MKKTVLFVSVLVAAMLLIAAAPALSALARFTVINNLSDGEVNGGMVQIQLNWSHASDPTQDLHFYFQVKPGTSSTFTVPRHTYDATVWACGKSSSATIDILTNLSLNFPTCGTAANAGEPSMEKVVLKSSPAVYQRNFGWYNLQEWRFQFAGYDDNPGACMILVDTFDATGKFTGSYYQWAEDGTMWTDAAGTYQWGCNKGFYRSNYEDRPSKLYFKYYADGTVTFTSVKPEGVLVR